MNILDDLGMLNILSSSEKIELEKFCQERILIKGEKLFNEGDIANSIYFLKKGGISIFRKFSNIDSCVGEILAEDILGEMSIFGGGGKRNASAIANQDSILIVIMSFSIKDIAKKNPKLLLKIQEIIEHRIMKNKLIISKK